MSVREPQGTVHLSRIAALNIALMVAGCGGSHAPSDESIIARFTAHRAEFDRLLEMIRHDGVFGRFSCDEPPHIPLDAPPVSEARRTEYSKLLKAIGGNCVLLYDRGSGRMQLFMWSTGLLFAGQDKSILYSVDGEPSPLVKSTDNYRWTSEDHRRGAVVLHRQIDGPWYLLYVAN